MKLTGREIERINAVGPFNHSIWKGKGVSVSNEEVIEGRAQFLARTVRKTLLKHYGKKGLARKGIADVDAYDGRLLNQLEDLPFREMVSIEPRRKNIEKGKKIRKMLRIPSRQKFVAAAIETLPKKSYDIVLCVGTLHHVESIPLALRKLDAITRETLIIETLCLPEAHETPEFLRDIEMKDVIYAFKPKRAGLTGHQFESAYYDGSAAHTTVVSVPSITTLLMYLDVLGYDAEVAASPQDFKRAMKKNPRPSQEVMICAQRRKQSEDKKLATHIAAYERMLVSSVLPRDVILPLYRRFCLREAIPLTGESNTIGHYMQHPRAPLPRLASFAHAAAASEIIRTFRYNPFEKISLEYAKILIAEKRLRDAVEVLQTITHKVNADWRASYRAFYLLAKVHIRLGDTKKSRYYQNLCMSSNTEFARAMTL